MNSNLGMVGVCALIVWVAGACSKHDPKFQQYYVQGEQLYLKHCSNCHQKDGKGFGLLYPPLAQSDYLDKNYERVICLIKNGIEGELVVNGDKFNQPMPANPLLTDLEIAEIVTYVTNSWGSTKGISSVQDVTKVLNACQ